MKHVLTLSMAFLVALGMWAQKPDKKLVKLAQKGDTTAQLKVARFYMNIQPQQEKNLIEAYNFFEMAGKAGHVDAMLTLAELTDRYPSIVQGDLTEPIRWMESAAAAGNTEAMLQLGDWFAHGHGIVAPDQGRARDYYIKAAKVGEAEGWYRIAQLVGNLEAPGSQIPERYAPLKSAADMGHQKAAAEVGILLFQHKDFYEASLAPKYLQIAADAGDAEAMNYLGRCYSTGLGVKQDVNQKFLWFNKAAESGNATAISNVAYCYEHGEGVEQDIEQAAAWYIKAADAGDANALLNVAKLYYSTKSPIHDYAKAVSFLEKAVGKNVSEAEGLLGICQLNGWGVSKDERKAIKNIEKGSYKFNDVGLECSKALARCYREGIGVEKSEKQAEYYEKRVAELERYLNDN